MNRIQNAFANHKAFIAFVTAGDPSIEKTEETILEMARAGADLIEIGIPFSDPIAEGSVIQNANVRALQGGCTTDKVFEMVQRLREKTETPFVFMTYANLVFAYGYDRFFARCAQVGVDGLILPDVPYEEKEEVTSVADQYDVTLISMIAPTSKDRIRMIAGEAKGFIYLVSSMGVTGMRSTITTDLQEIIDTIRTVTDTPVAVGFGIHTREQVLEYQSMADGVIVGSGIVRLLEEYKEKAPLRIASYVKELTGKSA